MEDKAGKIEPKTSTREEIITKVDELRNMRERHEKTKRLEHDMLTKEAGLNKEISDALLSAPEGVKDAVLKSLDNIEEKHGHLSDEHKGEVVLELMEALHAAYVDKRPFLSMYNRTYADHRMLEHIDTIIQNDYYFINPPHNKCGNPNNSQRHCNT